MPVNADDGGFFALPSQTFRHEPFMDANSEMAYIESYNAQITAAEEFAQGISQEQALNIADWAKVNPHLPPGVTVPMGASGIDPLSEFSRSVSELDAVRNFEPQQAFPAWGPMDGSSQFTSPLQIRANRAIEQADSLGMIDSEGDLVHPGEDASQTKLDTFSSVLTANEALGLPTLYKDGERLLLDDPASDEVWDMSEYDPSDPDNFDMVVPAFAEPSEQLGVFNQILNEENVTIGEISESFGDMTIGDLAQGFDSPETAVETGQIIQQLFDAGARRGLALDIVDNLGLDDEERSQVLDAFNAAQPDGPALPADFPNPFIPSKVPRTNSSTPLADTLTDPDAPIQVGSVSLDPEGNTQDPTGIGRFMSLVGQVAGPVSTPVGNFLDRTLPDSIQRFVSQNSRRGLRGVSMVLNAPVQAAQGLARDLAASEWEGFSLQNPMGFRTGTDFGNVGSQTDLGVALDYLLAGEEVDVGEGFLVDPDSEVARARRHREAQRGQIGGHNISIGRIAADTANLSPDSRSWDIVSGLTDAAFTIAGDPTAWASGGLAAASRSRRLFRPDAFRRTHYPRGFDAATSRQISARGPSNVDDIFSTHVPDRLIDDQDDVWSQALDRTGGLASILPAIDSPTPTSWAQSRSGQKVLQAIADERSPAAIWRAMGRRDPRLSAELAQITDPNDVFQHLAPHLGPTFRQTTDVWHPSVFDRVRRPRSAVVRSLHRVPGTYVDTDDLPMAAEQLELWGANARLAPDIIDNRISELAHTNTRAGVYGVFANFFKEDVAPALGASDEVSRGMTSMFREYSSHNRLYFTDEIGQPINVWDNIVMDGTTQRVPSAHVSNEFIGRYLPLPDFRKARRATSKFGRLMSSNDGELVPVAQKILSASEAWKPWAFIRPAYIGRTAPEEQGRMYFAGYDSMFNHPARYIMNAIRRRKGDKIAPDALSESFEFKRAMTRDSGNWITNENPKAMIRGGHDSTFVKNVDDQYDGSVALEFQNLYLSEEARYLAAHGLDETVEWMNNGGGGYIRRLYAESGRPEFTQDGYEPIVRRYLETVENRIQIKTGGNMDLRNVIATGRLGSMPMLTDDGMRINSAFTQRLKDYYDVLPEKITGPSFRKNDSYKPNVVVDTAFDLLIARPQDELSKSQVFFQAYWNRMREMSHYADDTALARVVADAERYGVDKRLRRDISRRMGRQPVNQLNYDEITAVSKSYALDEVKNLLYDYTQRSQFMDANRLVFPFGEAWKDIIRSWSKLARVDTGATVGSFLPSKPAIRTHQAYQEVQGWFTEGEFGDVFEYPMMRSISDNMIGVPLPWTGTAEGMSMMNSVAPGVGPVIQIPAALIMRGRPQVSDTWRELLLPYGAPFPEENPLAIGDILNFAPPWVNYATRASLSKIPGVDLNQDQAYAGAMAELMAYELSTGQWDTSSHADMQELVEHVEDKAPAYFGLRALAVGVAPSAPQPEWVVEDPTGRVTKTFALRDTLFELRENHGYEEGNQLFVKEFNEELLAIVDQGRTESRVRGQLPTTREFSRWLETNGHVKDSYPDIYHLLFPGDRNAEFDNTLYRHQLASGERRQMSPEEWMWAVHDSMAREKYNRARRKVGGNPTPEQRTWLRNLRSALRQDYPGYLGSSLLTPADLEVAIDQLHDAAQDPAIVETELGTSIQRYLTARGKAQEAIDQANQAGVMESTSFRQSIETQPIREWLRNLGNQLAAENPEFQYVWDAVLEREMIPEEEEPQPQPQPRSGPITPSTMRGSSFTSGSSFSAGV